MTWLHRMARAGADVVGVNCHFDPFVSLEALRKMKGGLDAAGLHPYLMCQPLAYFTPDAGTFVNYLLFILSSCGGLCSMEIDDLLCVTFRETGLY